MVVEFDGSHGHALSSLEWLLLHHKAKRAARRRIASKLCLMPGMAVVDLGCGPGLWTELLAEQIGPHGSVVGIDLDERLLNFARCNLQEELAPLIRYEEADFHDLPQYQEHFDLAFSANCFAYLENPVDSIRTFSKYVKPGGCVLGRHFDNTTWVAYPVPVKLSLKVQSIACQAGRRDPSNSYFDNSFGQAMHTAFRSAGLINVRTESTTIDLIGPLSRAQKDYISLTAEWTADLARTVSADPCIDDWLGYFDPKSNEYILEKADCVFTFVEYTSVGVRGRGRLD